MITINKSRIIQVSSILLFMFYCQACSTIRPALNQAVEETKDGIGDVVGYLTNKKKYNGKYFKDNIHRIRDDLNATLKSMGLENLVITAAFDSDSQFIQTDEHGRAVYTETRKRVKISGKNIEKFSSFVIKAADKYEIDPALIYAVIRAESGFNPNAVSPVGAQGLMQLMPATAKMLGVKDSFDPEQNIMGGTLYLRMLSKEFKSQELVLAAYNAGPGNVKKYGNKIPPFPETKKYVVKVCKYCDQYKFG